MQQNYRVRLLGSMLLLLGLVGMLTACSDPSCAVVAPIAPVVHILVDRETVYLNSQNGPYALQAPTGTQRWHKELGSFAQGADEGTAYIFSGSMLNAVRVNDAVVLWQQPLHGGHSLLSPLEVSNGVVYLEDSDTVLALSATDGAQLWRQSVADVNTIHVSDGAVYVGGETVSALQASDGALLWTSAPLKTGWRTLALAVDGDQVYASVCGRVAALNMHTGQTQWSKDSGCVGVTLWGANNGAVYLGSAGTLEAVRGRDDASLWKVSASGPLGPPITNVAVTADAVYFTAGKTLTAVRADTGAKLWQQNIPHLTAKYSLALTANADKVFVGASAETLDASGCRAQSVTYAVLAFHADTGTLAWFFEDDSQTGTPAPLRSPVEDSRRTPEGNSRPTPTSTGSGR